MGGSKGGRGSEGQGSRGELAEGASRRTLGCWWRRDAEKLKGPQSWASASGQRYNGKFMRRTRAFTITCLITRARNASDYLGTMSCRRTSAMWTT